MSWITIIDDEPKLKSEILTAFSGDGPLKSLWKKDSVPNHGIERIELLWKVGEAFSGYRPRSGGGSDAIHRGKDQYRTFLIFNIPVQEYQMSCGYMILVTASGEIHHYGRKLTDYDKEWYDKMLELARKALVERKVK